MGTADPVNAALLPVLEQPATHFYVALSGGIDSVVLLHSLCALRASFPQHQYSAIHVHHGLSANADSWQRFVEQLCGQLDIRLLVERVNLLKQTRTSLEAVAREARYGVFVKHAQGACVLLAQHLDDQLETILLQLKRGAGPAGLAAMPVRREDNGVTYLRPYLALSRAQIEHYAYAHDLRWVEDESNQDVRFDRNFLRHEIIPRLAERWPHIADNAARSAQLCAQQQALLDEVLQEKLVGLQSQDKTLSINGLHAQPERWQSALLRSWLAQFGLNPSAAWLQNLQNQLVSRQDGMPEIKLDGRVIRRFNQRLFCLLSSDLWQINQTIKWQGEHAVSWDAVPVLLTNIQCNQQPLEIGNAPFSLRFTPVGELQSKPLNQWFKQWQVAPWLRQQTVVVRAGESIIAIAIAGENWRLSQQALDWQFKADISWQ